MAVDESTMGAFVRTLPKAELHVHIEGTLEPELLMKLAGKHGVALPYASVDEVAAAYEFSELQDFLDVYFLGASVLRDEDDFHELTARYLERARAEGIVHAEIMFDPQLHTQRGVAFETVLNGITRALDEAREGGISSRLILCFLRHLSEDDATATLEAALPFRERIDAVGLDAAEADNPPSRFSRVFARARAEGLHVVAHAGEEGPPAYIREALDELGAERIDHGVRCDSDEALVERLAAEEVPLTVCPLSNVRLGVFERLEEHNLGRLIDRGLMITLNSDDPAYFGGYLAENYLATWRSLGLDAQALRQLARNSFEAAFLPREQKDYWLRRVAGVPTPR